MYEQMAKHKENRIGSIGDSVSLKKTRAKQRIGSMDNQSEANIQLSIIQKMNNGGGVPVYVSPRQRRINAVQAAFAGLVHPVAAGAGILVFHPPQHGATWEYTRTVQYTIPVPGLDPVIVRGHIHYTNTTGVIGPGRMWISGVGGYDFATPAWVVNDFNTMPSLVDRQAAVEQFNQQHNTNHNVL